MHRSAVSCRWAFFLLLSLVAMMPLAAQERPTVARGKVVDGKTGDALPFVQVLFAGSQVGTLSDMEGKFQLQNMLGYDTVEFRMMGYETLRIGVKRGEVTSRLKIELHPTATTLKAVKVTPKGKRERYRRKENPAVELAREVIAHKDTNRPTFQDHYLRSRYDKSILALDDFHPNYDRHIVWKHLPFVSKYVGLTPYDNTAILNIMVGEAQVKESYRKSPLRRQTLVIADRNGGLGDEFSEEGVGETVEDIFTPVDIYDNEIELLDNRFVSPLSSTIAITFYHYYITDTVDVDGQQCVVLSFAPADMKGFGFTGQMYIALDGTYAVRRYTMVVSPQVNINFAHGLTVVQSYTKDSAGRVLPVRGDVYGRLGFNNQLMQRLFKGGYLQHTVFYHDYDFESSPDLQPDSLFSPLVHSATLPRKKMLRHEWDTTRPMPLSLPETMVDSFRYEFAKIPWVKRYMFVGKVLLTGYVPTSKERDSSNLDFGSIYNLYSSNGIEGDRVRLGWMTKAHLNPRNFTDGYVAYGFRDQRPKFGLGYYHTFDDKKRYYMESPYNYLAFNIGYDIESPGQSVSELERDNVLMSTESIHPALYVGQAQARWVQSWPTNIHLDTRLTAQYYEPAGALTYRRIQPDGSLQLVDHFYNVEWVSKLRYSPQMKTRSTRKEDDGSQRLFNRGPVVSLEHKMGVMEGFYYNSTLFEAQYRLRMAVLGYMDFNLQAGKVWNAAPLPKLFIPNGSVSNWLLSNSFNTMLPMEYIVDQYASLFATYHLKGLILDHIPIIRVFGLREVVGFNVLYGGLTDKNNPALLHPGLYAFPEGIKTLGSQPYAEYSIGVENILGIFRVDYVRRLTYLEPGISPYGIKFGIGFAF